ncbi:MAG: hypothetical protein NT043_01060 [Candidatus Bathyarchaeota archaeon]|nr:hypothetical protein [Candidatus Bathyarchaeota archaeon]
MTAAAKRALKAHASPETTAPTATADGVTEQDKAKVRNLENTGFDG